MISTEHNPTDILAQKRAESNRPEAKPSLSSSYWADRLNTPEGRAAIFAELVHADLFGEGPPLPASDQDLWVWIGARLRSARLLREAMEIAPLSVGSMWAEAMKREFENQAGNQ